MRQNSAISSETLKQREGNISNITRRKIKREECAFFVAEENTRIIGYILGETDTPEHHYIYEERGYLADIFVLEKYRGMGIGEKLTKRLLEWFKARGIKWIRVSAYTNNVPAIKFWKKMGFKDYVIVMTHLMRECGNSRAFVEQIN